NHGLVIGGDDVTAAAHLLAEVSRRLFIPPRQAHPADYAMLLDVSADSSWTLPDDDRIHAFATDTVSQAILDPGLLYPCQGMLSGAETAGLFRPIPCPGGRDSWEPQCCNRPFLILDGLGVLVNPSATLAELATISGLA